MIIRFYDKATLALKGEFASFIQTTQTAYINAVGTFEIVADSIPNGLNVGDVIYVQGTECIPYCGEITQLEGDVTAEGRKFTFKGNEIVGLLSERMPLYTTSSGTKLVKFTSSKREDVIRNMFFRTFAMETDEERYTEELDIESNQNRGETISYECDPQKSVLDNMYTVASAAQWGIQVQPNFEIGFYLVKLVTPDSKPKVILSPKFDNLTNEHFVISTSNNKNVAYYSWTVDETTTYGSVQLNAGTGLNRKERWIDASTGDGKTEDAARAIITMQLGNYKTVENYTGDYQASKTFTFGEDFQLGDIVTYAGETGTAEVQVVGYTQTHGEGKYTMQLIFGSNLIETVRNIQEIERRK